MNNLGMSIVDNPGFGQTTLIHYMDGLGNLNGYKFTVDFAGLTEEQIDEVVIYGRHKLIMDDECLEKLSAIQETLQLVPDELFWDPSPSLYQGHEAELDTLIELCETKAKLADPAKKRNRCINRIMQLQLRAETIKAKIKEGDQLALAMQQKLDTAKNEKRYMPKQQFMMVVKRISTVKATVNLWIERAHSNGAKLRKLWTRFKIYNNVVQMRKHRMACLQTQISKLTQGTKLWPAYYQLQDSEINCYLTKGEVTEEYDSAAAWNESINYGEELANQHIAEEKRMAKFINAPFRKDEEVKTKEYGYVPKCKELHKVEQQPNWNEKQDEYMNSLMASVDSFLNR